jgi:hypothetical protein
VGSSGLVSGRPTPLHGHLGTASFSLLGGLLSIGSQDRTIRCPRSGRQAFPKRKMDCVRRAGTWNSRGTFFWTWPAHTGLYWNRRAAPLEPRRRPGRPLYHQLASFKYYFSTHAYYRLGCGFGPPLTTQRSGRNFPPDRLVSEHRKEFPGGWSADASVIGLWKGCPSLRSNHEGTMAEHIPTTSRWTGPLTNLMLFRSPYWRNWGTTCQRILGCRNEPRLDWLCFVNTNIGNEVLISLPPFSVLLVATRATATSGQRNRIATDVTSFLFGREKIADTSRHMSHTTGLTYCCSLS